MQTQILVTRSSNKMDVNYNVMVLECKIRLEESAIVERLSHNKVGAVGREICKAHNYRRI